MIENLNKIIIDDISRIQKNFFSSGLIDELESDLKINAKKYIKKDNLNIEGIINENNIQIDAKSLNDLIEVVNLLDYIYNICFITHMCSKMKNILVYKNSAAIDDQAILINSDISKYLFKNDRVIKKIDKDEDLFDFIKNNEDYGFFNKILNEKVLSKQKYKDVVFVNIDKALRHLLEIKGIRGYNAEQIISNVLENVTKRYKKMKLTEFMQECPTDYIKNIMVISNNNYDNNKSIFKSIKINSRYAFLYNEVDKIINQNKNSSELILSGFYNIVIQDITTENLMLFINSKIYELKDIRIKFKAKNKFSRMLSKEGVNKKESISVIKEYGFVKNRIDELDFEISCFSKKVKFE